MNIDIARLSRKEAYQLMTHVIVPRPIAWISTINEKGIPNLAPFSYFMGVSSQPPVVAISIAYGKGKKRKDTAINILNTREFVINVVTAENFKRMNATAANYKPEVDEFEEVGLTRVPSQLVKPFRVKESPIHLECHLMEVYRPSEVDGEIFLGKVVLLHIDDDILEEGLPSLEKMNPVGRVGTTKYAQLSKIIDLPIPRL